MDDEASLGPVLGEKDTCVFCNREVEWIGPHWRHINYSPRHVVAPKNWKKVKKDGPLWRKVGT